MFLEHLLAYGWVVVWICLDKASLELSWFSSRIEHLLSILGVLRASSISRAFLVFLGRLSTCWVLLSGWVFSSSISRAFLVFLELLLVYGVWALVGFW